MHLDRELNEISYEQWQRLLALPGYCQVAKTMVDCDHINHYEVVTTWIGYDIQKKGRVFATAVFNGQQITDLAQRKIRTSNLDEALIAHENVCKMAKSGQYKTEIKEILALKKAKLLEMEEDDE